MENMIETDNIALDYSKSREDRDLGAYRLTTYDKYGHIEDDIYISGKQLQDLVEGMKGFEIDVEEEFL